MKYDLLLFDADETLFDFKKSQDESLENSIKDLGFDFDRDYHLPIYNEVNSKIWCELEEGKITQADLKIERFRRFTKQTNMNFDADKCAKLYIFHLSQSSILYKDSVKLLEQLKGKYRLAIITNGLTKVQEIRIRKSEIASYFDVIVISEEIQIAKPEVGIFEHVFKLLEFNNREKVLMIGDRLSSDIRGGVNAGIDTCWYNPDKQQNNTELKPTYEVSELMQILDIVR